MKNKAFWIGLLTVLLIAGNVFLLLKENRKVERTFYIKNWTTVKQQNLKETMPIKGVFVPFEKQQVYYDAKKGSFKQFLVQVGDEVEQGTALFEYSEADVEQTRKQLEADKAKLERDILNLESQLEKLYNLQYDLTLSNEEENPTYDMMNISIEQDIYEKEQQLDNLQSEIERYDELLMVADENLFTLTEESYLNGTVTNIKEDLSNPIMTIMSNEQKIEGTLTEQELARVEEGMEVYSTTKRIIGTIESISTFPEEEPKVEKESKYPFTVVLEENEEAIPHGAHVDLNIVTKERMDAITVPLKSIVQHQHVFVLENGRLEKRKIEKGLQLHSTQEIETGLEPDEIIALERPIYLQNKTTFFTPIQLQQWKNAKKLSKKQFFKTIAKGFFSN